MYRCNDCINCLSVSADKINESIQIEAFKASSNIVSCKPLGKRIIITCSLVCTVRKDAYLDVKPDYVWLTPDILASAEFDIISNVDWSII